MWAVRRGNAWNRMFRDELVKAQSPDGSWPPLVSARDTLTFTFTFSNGATTKKALSSMWPSDPDSQSNPDHDDGQTYRTTLCILMLESITGTCRTIKLARASYVRPENEDSDVDSPKEA